MAALPPRKVTQPATEPVTQKYERVILSGASQLYREAQSKDLLYFPAAEHPPTPFDHCYPLRIMRMLTAALLLTALTASAQQHPRDDAIHDPDTKSWWHTTEDLSNDSMEGRDTGTAAYQRAADMVAARFKAAGLEPAGESGSYFQTVPMHEVDIKASSAAAKVWFKSKDHYVELPFLRRFTVAITPDLPVNTTLSGTLVFRGYCGKDQMTGVADKFVLCFGTQRTGLPSGAERAANVRAAGAVGIMNIDDPYFTIEPPRWPAAYGRTVTLKTGAPPRAIASKPFVSLRIPDNVFITMLRDSSQNADAILKAGGAKQPLENFDLPGTLLKARFETTEKEISSPNVLAVLPGSDPALKDQYVVISAHLDGYGFGTPVKGDNLYNGALDDAAYVALLIQMADDIKSGKLPAPKRSILFCAFTGEEKGLLGSNWFTTHLTVPKEKLVADVNLDQLRPLFPLNILTAEAVNDTTLGQTARDVGAKMQIEIRDDKEPERGLLRRADQFPFLRIGVPAISFIFGYDPGTDAERRYREWYEVRYHRPQDDLTQPMDFDAATKFNTFFYTLVGAIADAPTPPSFLPGSQFVKK